MYDYVCTFVHNYVYENIEFIQAVQCSDSGCVWGRLTIKNVDVDYQSPAIDKPAIT